DIRATKLDPQLAPALHVRRLLAADAVVFSHRIPAEIFDVYDDTADRADYQALVPEFGAPPAESLAEHGQPSASKASIALRGAAAGRLGRGGGRGGRVRRGQGTGRGAVAVRAERAGGAGGEGAPGGRGARE